MREMKFRQVINSKGKFHHWHYWGYDIKRCKFASPDTTECGGESYQFTGLLDCKGKEIYEGDITRSEGNITKPFSDTPQKIVGVSITLHQIIWGIDGWNEKLIKKIKGNTRMINSITKGIEIHSKYCEVIGNIYEHKNLLDK